MPFTLSRNRIIIISGIILAITLLVGLFTGYIPGLRFKSGAPPHVKLEVWGVYDSSQTMAGVIDQYKKSRPNVEVNYYELDPITYEKDLINRLAAGTGPDIFMVHNTWLPKHQDKMFPLPETQMPFATFRDLFPQVVTQDFAPSGVVYASPLYIDTLAMFYNKDTFDKKAVALPPTTWKEFQDVVQKLKEINPNTNAVAKAGAAIGGSEKSINRATDLLGLLMLQNGTQMVTTDFLAANFAHSPKGDIMPGLNALHFYTQFANPASTAYTWNDNLHYSVDNFTEGTTAIIFNYAHQMPVFKSKNPFLNFGVAPVPQITASDQPLAYANYWGLAVSKESALPNWAWDFITYITTTKDAAKVYMADSKQPPALKDLLNENISHPDLGVFAKQALIARSWPQVDNNKVEESFSNMIDAVISGRLPEWDALQKAEDEITLLMRNR